MTGKGDWGEPQYKFKWISHLQVFGCFERYTQHSTPSCKRPWAWSGPHPPLLGAKTHTITIKRALKGCSGVLGKGEKGKDTFMQVELKSLKARV